MKTRRLQAIVCLLLTCALAVPALAGISPYIRLDYGGNQLRMSDGNKLIQDTENAFQAVGLPADFKPVGTAYGPGLSAGLWLIPGFRVGATYSYQRSIRHNHLHVPGQLFFADDLDFRMTEIGGEAAVRFERLHGLTFGGGVAQGKAEMVEGYTVEDLSGQLYVDATATRTKPSYGAFVGFDQTNPNGVAGFFRAGFQYRDMGHMPSKATISDGVTTTQATGQTIWLDYSGFYVKFGIGFDRVR